jgi:predicted nucleic acid-binding Zn ribbon protein
MQRAGEFLGRVVRRLERPEAALAWLAGSWPSVVGKALAAHTRPVRCAAGRLEIAADRRAWQKQLEEMKREICARVNQAWGGDLVHEVKLVATEPDSNRVPPEANNEHTPFVRRNRDSDT